MTIFRKTHNERNIYIQRNNFQWISTFWKSPVIPRSTYNFTFQLSIFPEEKENRQKKLLQNIQPKVFLWRRTNNSTLLSFQISIYFSIFSYSFSVQKILVLLCPLCHLLLPMPLAPVGSLSVWRILITTESEFVKSNTFWLLTHLMRLSLHYNGIQHVSGNLAHPPPNNNFGRSQTLSFIPKVYSFN